MSTTCYPVLKGIDEKIAEKLGGGDFTAFRVATLRGMYDDSHKEKPLDLDDLDKAAAALAEYRKTLKDKKGRELMSFSTNYASAYRNLSQSMTAEERFNRINMISNMFSQLVYRITQADGVSRKQAVNGYERDGRSRRGEMEIFDSIYKEIVRNRNALMNMNTPESIEKAEKLQRILDNWNAIIPYVRAKLRDTEGVKLGNKYQFADETDESNFNDNDLSQIMNPEESIREHWTMTTGMESSFGSIGQQVRRLLGSLPVMERKIVSGPNGVQKVVKTVQRDDLGIPMTLDPVIAHQRLAEILTGTTSSKQMMEALKAASDPWIEELVKQLNTDPKLQTQLFVDMRRGFQKYYILTEDKDLNNKYKGLRAVKTKCLNLVEDFLGGAFMSRVLLGRPINEASSVYDNRGRVRFDRLQKVIDAVKDNLYTEEDTQEVNTSQNVFLGAATYGKKSKFFQSERSSRRQFLVDSLVSLGFDTDADTVDRILNNAKETRNLTKHLKNLVKFGLKENNPYMRDLSRGQAVDYKSIVGYIDSGQKKGFFQENVDKINTLLTNNREKYRVESRVQHKDSKGNRITLFSHVNPSYLNDRLEVIQSYVKTNSKKELLQFLEDKYLSSPMFRRADGTILNKWLEELVNACKTPDTGENAVHLQDTFAGKLEYMRMLGTSDESFENFTSKQHMIDMFAQYRALMEQSGNEKNDNAWYPIFVLGDSGVSKYLKAKRYIGEVKNGQYENETILNGLWNVYRQETERMKLVNATNQWLADGSINGRGYSYKGIDNFSKSGNTFSTLQFLNKDYVSPDGQTGKYARMLGTGSEAEVKAAIQAFMNDAVADFKDKMRRTGVLETIDAHEVQGKNVVDVKKYKFLGKNTTPENIDEKIADFYWNTKFATIQQLQLMTIDPAFYVNTKDLQKRYKEIHAPGTILDVFACDKNGIRYIDGKHISDENIDTSEFCVYFDDIDINAEDSDRMFMESILYTHAVVDRNEVQKAVAEGVLVPITGDEAAEKARKNRLKSLLGNNYSIYNKYTKNTLTDGQGYRTLDSYRKVMLMAGKWTDEMQHAYDLLKQAREEFGENGEIPAERLKEIADAAVVFMPIKPYLFGHERLQLNNNQALFVPVQHKYAEAVLIPELLPVGSKLRDLAYWMEKKDVGNGRRGVDMVCSTKAVKVGAFGSTNIADVTDSQSLNNAMDAAYIHRNDYRDYRIQTNVPEHINSSQLFGTQLRKLIMSNIQMDSDRYMKYINSPDGKVNLGGNKGKVRLTGRNLVSFYNSLIVSNIMESLDTFVKTVENVPGLSDTLIQNIINNSRESMDNILAFSLTGNSEFLMPLFEGGLEHDAAALLLSTFKKLVNKQAIKGGSAVQVSAMGIKNYEKDGGLKYVMDPNNPNNILYAECEIPFDLSFTDASGNEIALEYDDYVNFDGSLKMSEDGKTSLIEKEFPGILDIIAYRIPTERAYSMINLKVVRFSKKTEGGTIKVPAPGTTISGFDFDIDKLYFLRKELVSKPMSEEMVAKVWNDFYNENPSIKRALQDNRDMAAQVKKGLNAYLQGAFGGKTDFLVDEEKDRLYKFWEDAGLEGTPQEAFAKQLAKHPSRYREFETYNYDKSPLENKRASRNNMLIDLIKARLMDDETMVERTTPGGFANASRSARFMRELTFGDLSGIYQNGKVNFDAIDDRIDSDPKGEHDPEPNYDPSDPFTIITYNQQNQVAAKLIGIFANQNTNHAFASLMSRFQLVRPISFAGHIYGNGVESSFIKAPDGVDVNLNVAEFLAASVDAVKDPVLNFMNLNTITADAGAMLARIGYTPTEIGLLFNQPIIKQLCQDSFNDGVSADIAIRNLLDKFKENGISDTYKSTEEYNQSNLTAEQLAKNIVEDRIASDNGNNKMSEKAFAEKQLEILHLFQEIYKTSQEVSDFIKATKFTASNAVGSTFGDMYAQQLRVRNYLESFGGENSNIDMAVFDVPMAMRQSNGQKNPNLAPVNNTEALLSMSNEEYLNYMIDNPFAYEQAMFDANRKALKALMKYFPYDTTPYSKARELAATIANGHYIDAETINSIHSDMMVYMLSSQEYSEFNPNLPITVNGKTYTSREYYTEHFAQDLQEFLFDNPEIKSLPIFQHIVPDVEKRYNKGKIEYVHKLRMQDVGGLQPHMKDAIKESWAELAKDEETFKWAKGMFMYNFYKLGFGFSYASFMNLAPIELKEMLQVPGMNGTPRTYREFLQDIMDDNFHHISETKFIRQWLRNHLDNKKFGVSSNSEVTGKAIRRFAMSGNIVANEFTFDISHEDVAPNSSLFLTFDNKKGTVAFTPILRLKLKTGEEVYYMADDFGKVESTTMKYRRVDKLGVKGQSLQYFGESEDGRPQPISESESQEEMPDGSTAEEDNMNGPEISDFDREAAINYLANEYFKAFRDAGFRDEQGEVYSENILKRGTEDTVKDMSDAALQAEVERIRHRVERNVDGVMTVDSSGNPIELC